MFDILERVESYVKRARAVLQEYGLPTTQQGLIDVQNKGASLMPDCYIEAAVQIVWEHEALLIAVEKNDMKRALTALHNIMQEYQDLSVYMKLGDKRIDKDYPEFRKIPHHQIVTDQVIRNKFKEMSRNKERGGHNKITQKDKDSWQEIANKLYMYGESKKSLTNKVFKALQELDSNTVVKYSRIYRDITIPS